MKTMMDKMKILVTCPPMLKQIDEFRYIFEEKGIELITPEVVQVMSESELIDLVPTVDGWIIGDDPATEKVFTAAKAGNLKAAVKWGVGIDNVDFKACEKLEIPITNTPHMFGGEVADLALTYLLGLARDSYYVHEEVKKGNWVKPSGFSVAESTVAVVGLGDIGQSTIRRLKGFDVTILAYDPFANQTAEELGIEGIYNFPNQIEKADFIILTCSLTPSSKHIINKESINRMKDGVRIINVSRGPLINEADLIAALKTGKVKSAALDVFEEEPLSLSNELLSFKQNIFGSHNGSNTKEAVRRASHVAINKLFGFLNLK
jgi:D-3-phosphoglycerate dehydrogenase